MFPSRQKFKKENAQKNKFVQKTNNALFFPYKCNYCDKIGHKYAECRKRLSEQAAKKSEQNAQPLNQKSKLMNKLCFSATTGNNTGYIIK